MDFRASSVSLVFGNAGASPTVSPLLPASELLAADDSGAALDSDVAESASLDEAGASEELWDDDDSPVALVSAVLELHAVSAMAPMTPHTSAGRNRLYMCHLVCWAVGNHPAPACVVELS